MSNMSYCRFHNTLMDMDDCLEALTDREIESEEERNKAETTVYRFLNFCLDEGIIENSNTKRVREVISECE